MTANVTKTSDIVGCNQQSSPSLHLLLPWFIDPTIFAVATDEELITDTLVVLDLNDVKGIAQYIIDFCGLPALT